MSRKMPDWPDNVWARVSIESQNWTWRMDILKEVPAQIHFLSCEPLLGPLNLCLDGIEWVIVGGESGARSRPVDVQWVREIRDTCLHYRVPFFFKQWRGVRKKNGRTLDGCTWDEFPTIQAHDRQQLSLLQ